MKEINVITHITATARTPFPANILTKDLKLAVRGILLDHELVAFPATLALKKGHHQDTNISRPRPKNLAKLSEETRFPAKNRCELSKVVFRLFRSSASERDDETGGVKRKTKLPRRSFPFPGTLYRLILH